MVEVVYSCAVHDEHPRLTYGIPCVVPPYCCGSPMKIRLSLVEHAFEENEEVSDGIARRRLDS